MSAQPPRQERRLRAAVAAVAITGVLAALALTAASPAEAVSPSRIRVDQAGYLPGEAKQAYLMTGSAVSGATFSVVDSSGATVLSGNVGSTSVGSWNTSYPDVYPISFNSLTTPGTYHIQVSGGTTASSPSFTIKSADSLYGKLVADGVTFFQTQRDGSNVIAGALNRQASHLNDASANIYAWPSFESGGSDTITNSDLSKIGGSVDVSGGWFDAGDYLKFTHTTAYGDALLFAAQRALGSGAPASLGAEAHFGETWLNKAWNQSTKTLYLQVGIGSGNSAGTFTGDHDLWRLPQKDDSDTASKDRYAAAHRPVFQAANAGAKVSPNLAGRISAAFALAAQVDATSNPTQAAAEYQAATSLYANANTSSPPNPLTTTQPNDYYPESTWHDDMEFGAAEIALAAKALGHDPSTYVSQGATWASDYLASDSGGDTFNLYDTSALAHADLIKAITAAGNPSGLAVTTTQLIADLKKQVRTGATKAASDIFHAGGNYTDFDVNAHTFGLIATEALYRQASNDKSYADFATEQRDWLLGANAWGTSFMVGEGSTFPHCPQHQVANISGSTDGTGAIATGALVNGPNSSSQFSGGLGSYETGMAACPPGGSDPFSAYTGHSSRYVDDVRSWQSSEPAIDMTGTAIVGAALQQAAAGSGTTQDFSVSTSPASGTVTAGSSATTTVNTSVTSGSAQSVSLSASGLPGGATASFSPSSVTTGASSTLTITTDSTTPAGSYPVTIKGTAASGSHTTTYTLTVNAPTGGCTAAQLLGNPGFENGSNNAPWTATSTLSFSPITQSTSAEPAHSGSWEAWFNGNGTADTDTIAQTVTVPSGCATATLSYWLHIDTSENTTTATPDTLSVKVLSSSGSVLGTVASYSNLNHNTGYAQHTVDVSAYAGQTITLKFTGTETDTNGGTTSFVVDDTALNVS
ncbi:glycoside hydrolase family 9 protein [Streptomyces sp. NPDC020801]|uniref:glycoside hydrolase family 9 protein n=1 Tax=unclassified Streptomyces TaxID=2593676 RepID=UPI0037BCC5D6